MATFAMQNPNYCHRPAEGEYFTLLQLQRKLAEWGFEKEDGQQAIFRGWDLMGRGLGESPKIPPVGTKFQVYVSRLFEPMASIMTVVREKHNVFRVVDWLG